MRHRLSLSIIAYLTCILHRDLSIADTFQLQTVNSPDYFHPSKWQDSSTGRDCMVYLFVSVGFRWPVTLITWFLSHDDLWCSNTDMIKYPSYVNNVTVQMRIFSSCCEMHQGASTGIEIGSILFRGQTGKHPRLVYTENRRFTVHSFNWNLSINKEIKCDRTQFIGQANNGHKTCSFGLVLFTDHVYCYF